MISKPNFWRVEYLVNTGTEKKIQTVDVDIDNLTELLYSISKNNIMQIIPLYVTEYKHPALTESEIDDQYNDM